MRGDKFGIRQNQCEYPVAVPSKPGGIKPVGICFRCRGSGHDGNHNPCGRCAGTGLWYGYARNVTVNNITNVTSVTNVTNVVGVHGERRRHRPRRRERKPELLTYCRSFGLMDREKVMRMSNGQLAEGAVDVMRYSSRNLGRHATGVIKSFGGLFGAIARIIDRANGHVVD